MGSGGIEIPVSFETGASKVTLEQLAAQVLELDASVKKLNQSTKQSAGGFSGLLGPVAKLAASYLSVRTAVNFVTDSIEAQSKQIDAINKLNLALANQGKFSDEASKHAQDLAASLQKVSTFGDETILAAEGQLATFGLLGDQLDRATKVTLDFAAATGRDLKDAANAVGKAFVGQTEVLKEIGVTVDKTKSSSEQFEQALGALEGRFTGAAQAATQTFTGGLKQLQNSFGDLQEAFGKFLGFLTGDGKSAFAGLTAIVQRLAKFFSSDLVLAVSEARAQFAEFVGATLDRVADLAETLNKIPGINIDTTGLRLAAEDQRTFAAETRELGNVAATTVGTVAQVTNVTTGLGKASALTAEQLKALKKHAEDVEKAFRAITGAVDPKAFDVFSEALAKIGSAGDVAVEQLDKVVEQILAARDQGLTLPPVADQIVERWLAMREATAAMEEFDAELARAGELSRLLGPTTSDLVGQFQDLQGAVEGFGSSFDDLSGLSEGRFRSLLDQVNDLDTSITAAGADVSGFGKAFVAVIEEANRRGIELPDSFFAAGSAAGDTKDKVDELDQASKAWGETVQFVTDLMSALGVEADSSLGKILGSIGGIASGFQGLAGGLSKLGVSAGGGFLGGLTSVLGKIGVAGQIASAAVGIGSAIVGLFKSDPVKKAQKEAGQALGVGISRELAESISKEADKLGIALKDAALLAIPDAIAESGAEARTFAGEILNLFDAIESGAVPTKEGIDALGESFSLVADQAIEAGRVGDVALRAIIRRSRELGQDVPEISAFVKEQLDAAAEGVGKFVDALAFVSEDRLATLGADAATVFGATFSALVSERGIVGAVDALGDSFGELRDRLSETLGPEQAAQLVSPFSAAFDLLENESLRPIVDGIDGLGQALTGLANSDFLDVNTFRAIERSAGSLFDELIAGGADTHTALLAIAPTIQAAISAADQFGIPLDENTQRLRDLAEQNGITFKTDPQQVMLDVLVEIAKVLGADIPASAQAAQDALTGLANTTPSVPSTGDFLPTPGVGPGGVPTLPPAVPGAPGAGGEAVQNVTTNNVEIALSIEQNPFQTAEGQEAVRRQILQTVDQAVDNLELRLQG